MGQVKEEHRKVRNLLARQTNPGFDPATSDHIAGEMQIALDNVLGTIEQLFDRYSKIGKG